MSRLSISAAWDETRAILARDGKLFASVALALVSLPSAVSRLMNPSGATDDNTAIGVLIVQIVASLVALAGQLALIRLALGPSITVGGAIAHGIRRVPAYFLAALIVIAALVIAAIPFGVVLAAMGVTVDPTSQSVPLTPATAVLGLIYFALMCFIGVRMAMASPAASAEPIGPIAILRRSWQLTEGHWWKLFGFLVVFVIGAVVLLGGIEIGFGVVVTMALGPAQAMSPSALVMALVMAVVSAVISTGFAVMLARIYAQLAGLDAQASVPSSGT